MNADLGVGEFGGCGGAQLRDGFFVRIGNGNRLTHDLSELPFTTNDSFGSVSVQDVLGVRQEAGLARPSIFLPAEKTKTKRDRRIPISTRLRAVLEMRRLDPAGHPHPAESFVFGTDIGTRVAGFKRAWATAVLRAHGVTPAFTATANFDADSRAALARIDLHFHDLRREAGSRWMDAGVPLATVQRWLGHSNISQTSVYLAGTTTTDHDAFQRDRS